MQLLTDKEWAANEVRTKLADNEYLRKQQSLLSDPGTSSADRFRIHEVLFIKFKGKGQNFSSSPVP